MNIHHLRNATLLLTLGNHRLLVDPMLAEPASMPGFKVFGGGRRRNPLVALPKDHEAVLAQATAVLVTHEHPDHFDAAGVAFAKQRGLTVWASPMDAASLRAKGLDVSVLQDGCLGMGIEVIPVEHGRGVAGFMMGPVSSLYLAHPDEPSVYLTSDSIWCSAIEDSLRRLRPDVVVAPAGSANFGAGGDILFSVDELVRLIKLAPGQVVLNHLEALDHCPTTRAALRLRLTQEGLLDRVHVPEDGELVQFQRPARKEHARPASRPLPKPGFQKWLTAKFA